MWLALHPEFLNRLRAVFFRLQRGLLSGIVIIFVVLGLVVAYMTTYNKTHMQQNKHAFQFSPYIDLNVAVANSVPLSNTYFSANALSLINAGAIQSLKGLKALTLAFANGECGKEHWGGMNAQKLATANLPALQQAQLGYIVSTGGADGMFTCDNPQGMDVFVKRYQSSYLLGFDFNIEAHQPPEVIQKLVHEVGGAMVRYPHLRFSFTLAAIAPDDRHNSLNTTGQWVMEAIAAEGLKRHVINLMVMNYGDVALGNCVVRANQCDMAASAIRAVNNVSRRYHLPLHQIEVTPMIGMNNVTANVFTLDDAHKLHDFAHAHGLGGLHFWSLNRDMPCSPTVTGLSATCHGLTYVQKLAFTQVLATPYPWASE